MLEVKKSLLNGGKEALYELLEKFDVNSNDAHGNNILHYFVKHHSAVSMDAREFVNKLLSLGIDINAAQSKRPNRTALHLAVLVKDKDLVELFIDLGSKIDPQDENGNTPLWQAIISYKDDDPFIIEYLIRHGADMNRPNKHGVSPLSLSQKIANYNSRQYLE